ncbi:short-chain dehydrogenase/reductase SDR [Sphingomonas sp. LH128]|uniref:Peroxisomal trans-2-enoyl-CoA reductase n=1 Tax=Novosphingobium resinovorum TaxID=158500 RepID=A0A031JWC5_9SPHN|nr:MULTISPECIES: SDR family oxidoreductase [Sphingomonadaceae]AOR79928.1 short-chain dehydrogenase [Novosphingobium resinovorum]EJU12249.1 short-chain dehydrogenase/reductase SDR [Sphingomonas sp. LH128]EZP81199.1 Short-chain dehydrogenase/reductase SDR [Novosphingobium resinovorum]
MNAPSNYTAKVFRPEDDGPDRPARGLDEEALRQQSTIYRDDMLAGQTVLITGAGSGMGKAAAFLAARLGANVAICGRDLDKLQTTVDLVREEVGNEVLAVSTNIRDPEGVEALIGTVHDHFGGLDTLVNNAGGQFPQDAIDFTRKGWLAVIDTNLNGTWWMMQEAAKRWREDGKPGNIVNIVANVERGMPQAAHTCAARAGVIYLSKTLATEWSQWNIRVNCIGPGVIETEGFRMYPEEALKRFHKANPMRMRGNAWDVAEAIAYLASPAARFINGDLIIMDGGQAQWGVIWPAGMPEYFSEDGAA